MFIHVLPIQVSHAGVELTNVLHFQCTLTKDEPVFSLRTVFASCHCRNHVESLICLFFVHCVQQVNGGDNGISVSTVMIYRVLYLIITLPPCLYLLRILTRDLVGLFSTVWSAMTSLQQISPPSLATLTLFCRLFAFTGHLFY